MAPVLGPALTPESLHTIARPVRIVVGARDEQAIPSVNAEPIAAAIPGAALEVVPDVTHYTFLAPCTLLGRLVARALCHDGAGVDEVRFAGSSSVVALFRDALDVFALPGEPRWRALERLLARVVADWEAEPSHRDPVFARDGWRCTVPGCSSRRNLHDHHVRFRSHGGDNRRTNRTTVCAAHHLHGIHAGIVRVHGAAPDLRWDLPLFSCIGDRYV
jgi:hypothetical protein